MKTQIKEYTSYKTANGHIAHVAHQGGYCSYFGSQANNELFHAIIRNSDNSKVDNGFFSDMSLSYDINGMPASSGFIGFEIVEPLN